jgi:hypothetical protein
MDLAKKLDLNIVEYSVKTDDGYILQVYQQGHENHLV